jgi:uncharacterized Zn-binding protein involved in type VI secretion
MGQKVARVGDSSDHGGSIVSTPQSLVYCNNILVAVIGAQHSCPIPGHGVTDLVSTPVVNQRIDGKMVCTIGAQAGCGATINSGSPDTWAE